MNICVIFNKRTGKEFVTSIENKDILPEGQEVFQSQFSTDSNLFDVKNVSCSQAVFDTVSATAGTRTAAKLIANATAEQLAGRVNVYIENGSLKIA